MENARKYNEIHVYTTQTTFFAEAGVLVNSDQPGDLIVDDGMRRRCIDVRVPVTSSAVAAVYRKMHLRQATILHCLALQQPCVDKVVHHCPGGDHVDEPMSMHQPAMPRICIFRLALHDLENSRNNLPSFALPEKILLVRTCLFRFADMAVASEWTGCTNAMTVHKGFKMFIDQHS